MVGLAALQFPYSVAGQTLAGVVLEEGAETPVAGAGITLTDDAGRRAAYTVADPDGRFLLEVSAGIYVLEASLLGYATTRSPRFTIDGGDNVTLEIMMSPSPIALEGLEVSVAREVAEALREFGLSTIELRERWIGPQEIEGMVGATSPRELIRGQNLAGVTLPHNPHRLCVRFARGRGCALNVLNGTVVTHGQAVDLDLNSLHAIALLTPAEATLFYGAKGSGGAVLMWTRAGSR